MSGARPWWGGLYLRWLQPLHNAGSLAPLCLDCRLLREARAAREFYVHDEPRWRFDELMAEAEPARIVTVPPGNRTVGGAGQTWAWDVENGTRRIT